MLTNTQIDQFINDGYVRVDHAFSSDVAAEGREILWKDTGCDPADPTSWTQPVVRLGMYYFPSGLCNSSSPESSKGGCAINRGSVLAVGMQ